MKNRFYFDLSKFTLFFRDEFLKALPGCQLVVVRLSIKVFSFILFFNENMFQQNLQFQSPR